MVAALALGIGLAFVMARRMAGAFTRAG